MATAYLIIGLIVLTFGADVLVKGASRLALSFGVPSLVIGLTVVAYGTSTPELAVSTRAAFTGESEIALGNVVGSNIANVWLILGLSALVSPLIVNNQIIRLELPIMIALSFLTYGLCYDGELSRVDGVVFLVLILIYTVATVKRGRKEIAAQGGERIAEHSKVKEVARSLVGLALLVWGAGLFVDGAVEIARSFGVSELVIGLTIVAVGTSMPEIMTSIVASYKGERDIAVGNVVGSNIFNILGVLGLSAVVKPIPVPEVAISFDIPVMILAAIMCAPFFAGAILTRWRALLFLGSFGFYVVYLIVKSSGNGLMAIIEDFILHIYAPLIVITVLAIVIKAFLNKNSVKAV